MCQARRRLCAAVRLAVCIVGITKAIKAHAWHEYMRLLCPSIHQFPCSPRMRGAVIAFPCQSLGTVQTYSLYIHHGWNGFGCGRSLLPSCIFTMEGTVSDVDAPSSPVISSPWMERFRMWTLPLPQEQKQLSRSYTKNSKKSHIR